MSKYYLYIVLCFSAVQACAQAPAPTPPATPATPAQPVYASTKEGWLVDLDEAYEISIKEKKPILANFTGSDWCGWCKKLDADVFSKPEFQAWAKENVVLLELDFPRRFQIPAKNQQQNAAMQQALQVTGYPTVWVINLVKDPTTRNFSINQLGKTGYTPTAEQFIATVDKFVHP